MCHLIYNKACGLNGLVKNSLKVTDNKMHLKKAGEYNGQNIVNDEDHTPRCVNNTFEGS